MAGKPDAKGLRVKTQGFFGTVDKQRGSTEVMHGICGSDKTKCRYNHFVTCAHAGKLEGHLQGCGAIYHGYRMARTREGRQI